MLYKTHLALGILAILLFLPRVHAQITFVLVALLATLLPDIDQGYSKLGHRKIFRPLQFFVRHRGMMHSFTVCFLIALVLAYFPLTVTWALPFFLGYGIHLFADAFTLEGIQPFWPYQGVSKGFLKTGSYTEKSFFIFLVVLDLFVAVLVFMK